MKEKQKYLFAALIVIVLLLFFSCGASGKVPNGTIDKFVMESTGLDSSSDFSWKATHSVDRQSHYDSVDIVLTIPYEYATVEYSCTALFIYDRSSDLWSLSEYSDWDLTSLKFNNKMIKTWYFPLPECTIDVTDVLGDKITLNYTYTKMVYVWGKYYPCTLSGSGTYSPNPDTYTVHIPVTMPDGFYVQDLYFQRDKNTELYICINLDDGIYDVFLAGSIRHDSE